MEWYQGLEVIPAVPIILGNGGFHRASRGAEEVSGGKRVVAGIMSSPSKCRCRPAIYGPEVPPECCVGTEPYRSLSGPRPAGHRVVVTHSVMFTPKWLLPRVLAVLPNFLVCLRVP